MLLSAAAATLVALVAILDAPGCRVRCHMVVNDNGSVDIPAALVSEFVNKVLCNCAKREKKQARLRKCFEEPTN